MYLETSRQILLTPLKMITGIVERKQTSAILGNVLIRVDNQELQLCATDSELELTYRIPIDSSLDGNGETTLPAFKLFDICRASDDQTQIQIHQNHDDNYAQVKMGRSRFTLASLPAADFPIGTQMEADLSFELPQQVLKNLLHKTQFAMAQYDVRYYLNGLLFDLRPEQLKVVATDGHRLALIEQGISNLCDEPRQVIIPRKAILELSRVLGDTDDIVKISLNPQQIQFDLGNITLRSQLIEGRFPAYDGVLPSHISAEIKLPVQQFKQALNRMAILSDDKQKNVRLKLEENRLELNSHSAEQRQEIAEENLDIEYDGDYFEIGFNIQYLQETLGVIDDDNILFQFSGIDSSSLIQAENNSDFARYVIMPMRL